MQTLVEKGFFRKLVIEILYNADWKVLGFTQEGLLQSFKRLELIESLPATASYIQLEKSFFASQIHPLQLFRQEWLKRIA